MNKSLQIKWNPNQGFEIVLADGRTFHRSTEELRKHGGIVGDSTENLIAELKANPNTFIQCGG